MKITRMTERKMTMIYRRKRRRMMTMTCRRRMRMTERDEDEEDVKDYENDRGKDDNDI